MRGGGRDLPRDADQPLPRAAAAGKGVCRREVNGKPTGRVDIDLSAVLYNADWRYVEHISYANLKSDRYRAAHSGDIVTAPNGACEFIDLDIESVVRYGGRYVVTAQT